MIQNIVSDNFVVYRLDNEEIEYGLSELSNLKNHKLLVSSPKKSYAKELEQERASLHQTYKYSKANFDVVKKDENYFANLALDFIIADYYGTISKFSETITKLVSSLQIIIVVNSAGFSVDSQNNEIDVFAEYGIFVKGMKR